MNVRRASLADEEDVAVLVRELGQAVGVIGDVNPVSWYSTLRKMLSSPEWTFLLAEDGKRKMGLLVLLLLPSLKYGGHTASITELIVSNYFQRRGIGTMLVEEAKKVASSMGCAELDVSVEVENEQAIGFYTKLGFQQKHADFGMKL